MGIQSLKSVDEARREREAKNQRDLAKVADIERKLNARPDCVVM